MVSGGEAWRGLCRQLQIELVQQQSVLRIRPGMARQDEMPAIGRRQMHIDHLEGGERLQDGARGQAGGVRPSQVLQGDVQAIGDERDEEVRLDPGFALMEDRADREVVLEVLEGLFDLGELHIVVPERRGVFVGQVRAQQVAALPAASLVEPVTPQADGEGLRGDRLAGGRAERIGHAGRPTPRHGQRPAWRRRA